MCTSDCGRDVREAFGRRQARTCQGLCLEARNLRLIDVTTNFNRHTLLFIDHDLWIHCQRLAGAAARAADR
jgi:hypothetical protein